MPTIELTAADVGDTADDDNDAVFVTAADKRVLAPPSVTDGRVFGALSVDDRHVFEPVLATDGCVLVPALSLSCAPVFVLLCRCFLEERGIGDGADGVGGCAFVAGTRLSAGFNGDDVADDGVPGFAGDEVTEPAGPVCEDRPSTTSSWFSVTRFCELSASWPRPSTHDGLDDVLACFVPAESSRRLRLLDHRSTGRT